MAFVKLSGAEWTCTRCNKKEIVDSEEEEGLPIGWQRCELFGDKPHCVDLCTSCKKLFTDFLEQRYAP